MPPKKYLSIEDGQKMLDTITELRQSIEDLKGEVAAAAVSTTGDAPVIAIAETSTLPNLARLEARVYDGDAVVIMNFSHDREAVKAINSLRRKVMASGINVACGDTVTCFRHLTRVVFSAELARDYPLLMKT